MEERTDTLERAAKPLHAALSEPWAWLVYLVFIWGAYLRLCTLTDPFTDNYHGANCSYLGMIARNWVRHGLWHLKFYQVMDGGPVVAGSELYTHHPPLIPLLLWFFFKLSGSYNEWCVRIMPIAFSLGAMVLLYVVVRRVWNAWIALLATACYAVMPYDVYFATMSSYETGGKFFFLLSVYLYLRYMKDQRFLYVALMCLSLVLGSLNDWIGFYVAPILGLHWLFLFPGKRRLHVLLYPAVAGVMVAIFFLAIAKAEGTWMIQQIAAILDPRREAYVPLPTLTQWIKGVIFDNLFYFCTPVVIVLTFLWIVGFLQRGVRRAVTHQDYLLLMLLSFGVIHVALGREWAFTHDFWASVLTPGLAVAVAVVVYNFVDRVRQYGGAGWLWQSLLYASLLGFGIFCTDRFYNVLAVRNSTDSHARALIVKANTEFADYVLTTDDISDNLPFRFYSDRNVGCHPVTTVSQFAQAYNAPYVGFSWAGGPRVTAILPDIKPGPNPRYFFMRDAHKNTYTPLYNFLKAAYHVRTISDYLVFDLRDPLVPEAELSKLINTQLTSFDFYAQVEDAEVTTETPEAEKPRVDSLTIGDVTRPTLTMAPATTIVFKNIPMLSANPVFKFAIAMPPQDWEKEGDGLVFEVAVEAGGKTYNLFSKYLNPNKNPMDRRWDEQVIDFSAFRDQEIDLMLTLKYGPEAQTTKGGWGSLEFVDASLLQPAP